ncbi:Hypothetical protein GLP15_3427 [Giardia lamblia P15]|uniref:Uncharacterized protein n=1 Tax=Giardia intestinalis (strain P15) TaxID=658858 RepID=E1F3J9_GIAIA|nr:Hypothetical protein GLP15_3427 [Giardia lamblia P15]
MSPQTLDISIDAAYQEAIKQIISSGALDLSTEAYNSALALSAGKTPVISSPHRTDPITDVYLSAISQDAYEVCSTPESRSSSLQTRSYNNSQGSAKYGHMTTSALTPRRQYQRDSDIIVRFQRDSAHIGRVDRSFLSYSALGTPSRQPINNRNTHQASKDRAHGHRGKASANHKFTHVEKQSARDFLTKLGLTPDTVPASEYDELLSLLLALKHRNFCDLNKVLSLFPYNAALNSMCTSLKSTEVREKLVDILRPSTSRTPLVLPCTESSPSKTIRPSKRKPKKRLKSKAEVRTPQLVTDANETNVSSAVSCNNAAVSMPGLDYYLNMAAGLLSEPSLTTDSSTQTTQTDPSTCADQSESGGDGSSHQAIHTNTILTFSTTQDELASLRELNLKLMQSHDFVVHELDNVTMQLNKEMEKTARLQALISEKATSLQGYDAASSLNGSVLSSQSASTLVRKPICECMDLVDKAISCHLTDLHIERQQALPTTFMDKEVQVFTSTTHSTGTSPHVSTECLVMSPLRRSTAEFIPAMVSDRDRDEAVVGATIGSYPEMKQRSNSVVNILLARGPQDTPLHLSTTNLSPSTLDLSPRSLNTTSAELVGPFNSVDSMLDLIASYVGASSTELKDQVTLSYSLAQLFRTGWYDTPCTQLAAIALSDIDLFESGELVHETPDAVEEFLRESYATSFGSFLVRPYDHSLLTLLLLCVYPAVMFPFASTAALFLAPVLHDVDRSTLDEYSGGCILFSALLDLTRAVRDYLDKHNLENLVSSVQTLLQTIKEFTGEIETSCLLPVILTLVRVVVDKVSQRTLISSLTESIMVTNDKICEIFITILSQVLKKITAKILSNDDEESLVTPEQQIALRMVRLSVQTLVPLRQPVV